MDKPSNQSSTGQSIADCLKDILERCSGEAKRRIPGEGGERLLRGWLISDLLERLLKWPSGRIVPGERFDLLLKDSEGFPVVTIETKTPGHKTTQSEYQDFKDRLSAYGTLRTAYITNGAVWEQFDISSPGGKLEIRERSPLHLEDATFEEIEAFFTPLFSNRYFPGAPRTSRQSISSQNPHILEALAADLDQSIGDLASFFRPFFDGMRDGRGGKRPQREALNLFDVWCEKSLRVPLHQTASQLIARFAKGNLSSQDILKILTDQGLTGDGMTVSAEELARLSQAQRQDATAVVAALWPAYSQAVDNLCAQTAHVVLARGLLYRIGEDQKVFPPLLSGEPMEEALAAPVSAVLGAPLSATDLLQHVRVRMVGFLSTVYQIGEFDWWFVDSKERESLDSGERAWLHQMDGEFERINQRLLRMLNGYFFGQVNVDVWRNVYQDYLPEEERQRLGGFYTPDELVNLILDLAEYIPEAEGLCGLSFIDPACGSGAFVTGALTRLLTHLEHDLPCHAGLYRLGLPAWKRAEEILNIVSDHLHAIDLHPFAAFLTTLNVLFLLLPLYVQAREKNPDFTLDLHIFSADSLEKPDMELKQREMFELLNSRAQLSVESAWRYQEVMTQRFDRVFGNPPWGGVLKGPLAPVYDTVKKRRFALEFPHAAKGKYDVYGLFMEHALQILKPGGRFGLLTQGSFIDKEWASGLRELFAAQTRLRYVVDLNPFGQLFFRRMNIPCITVADNVEADDRMCLTVLSTPPTDFKGLGIDERRKRVVATVREALVQVEGRRKKAEVGFAQAARVPRQQLRQTAKERWNLTSPTDQETRREGWYIAAELLEMRQGVTPGGCLDVFLMSEEDAERLGLEKRLVHRAIKSKKVGRWCVEWIGQVLLYPYHVKGGDAIPAFAIDLTQMEDQQLAEVVRRLGVRDALDFSHPLDRREEEVVHRRGVNRLTVGDLLKHRIALKLVRYPKVAEYLVQHYERLEGRVFEKKRFTEMGKQWYEYHRPRDPQLMLSQTRIVSPTLMKRVRFALDTVGYLSDHACLYLQPTKKTRLAWDKLCGQLTEAVGRPVTDEDTLKYCLAFLNSTYAQERLVTGHRPRPGEVYAMTESVLSEIPIPPPGQSAAAILDLVGRLVVGADERKTACQEKELTVIVDAIMSGQRLA